MFIKFLKIETEDKVIRNIKFKKGVNLIVDTTSIKDLKNSGNNVGKTTVLRLIDFCLGMDPKEIYIDSESKKDNTKVKSYLEENNILITLVLVDNLDTPSQAITLERNFLKRSSKIQKINGTNYSKIELYRQELNHLLFNNKLQKPTFRQLIPRYIRTNSHKMDKVIYYLHPSIKESVYESIYLFLFNRTDVTKLSSEKDLLTDKIKFNNKVLSSTFQSKSAEALKQHLTFINQDILDIEKQKKSYNVTPEYESEFKRLKDIKIQVNKLNTNLSNNRLRLTLIEESIQELKEQKSNIDVDILKVLYDEASSYIPNLQKSFEELVSFHNTNIENKINYLAEELPLINENISNFENKLFTLNKEEIQLGKKLFDSGSLSSYELLVSKANKIYEQKGRLEEELLKLTEIEKVLEESHSRLSEINESLENQGTLLTKNIEEFNKFFALYSEAFYNERFLLSNKFDKTKKVWLFTFSDEEGNMGDGKKKGLIAAFDLAYISYCNSKNYATPHFTIHDRIEGIHENQLKSLFDVANSSAFNGQYIASILSGKFSETQLSENYLESNRILELSQDDKLFKIDNF